MLADVGAIVGSQGKQVEDFDNTLSSFCDKLLANVGVAT
ncbi:hypothetical protein NK6_3278 [Bradyrhizobium diazoefficiens]|uniref:Uncharacterized protein n=1 Tax=Bradyrhizobium diazoefficiens TaxID=1355477 RepID=A0A0E4FT86_9BRAD|nr:hypothetical protein NK6_3278 [Bradyrhizobium diazoefficiens]